MNIVPVIGGGEKVKFTSQPVPSALRCPRFSLQSQPAGTRGTQAGSEGPWHAGRVRPLPWQTSPHHHLAYRVFLYSGSFYCCCCFGGAFLPPSLGRHGKCHAGSPPPANAPSSLVLPKGLASFPPCCGRLWFGCRVHLFLICS